VEREKRDSSRGERSSYSKDKDTDLRLNKFIRANEHMKDSRRDVDARKKRKQIEKEMMKLQAKIGLPSLNRTQGQRMPPVQNPPVVEGRSRISTMMRRG